MKGGRPVRVYKQPDPTDQQQPNAESHPVPQRTQREFLNEVGVPIDSGASTQSSHDLSSLGYDVIDGVCRITIQREQSLNSLNLQVFREMRSAILRAGADDAVGVVVITGEGTRAFCAGADVNEHLELCRRPRDYVSWIREFVDMQTAVLRSPKPTIARLNGAVVAAGNELHLACDLAIAADHVTISQAGPKVGSVPGVGVTQWLPLTIGDRRARQMVFLCEQVAAEQALAWGLVNEVSSLADLDAAVQRLADRLLDTFPESLRYAKTALNQGKEEVWASSVPHIGEWLALHAGSPETHEGMNAFNQRRPPDHKAARRRTASDHSPEFRWGPPVGNCGSCGATELPAAQPFCGECGTKRTTVSTVGEAVR